MLELWEAEARADQLSEDLIQIITKRLQDYSILAQPARAEILKELWVDVTRSESGLLIETPFDKEKIPITQTDPETKDEVSEEEPSQVSESEVTNIPVKEIQSRPRTKTSPSGASATNTPAALNAPVTVLHGVGDRIAQTLSRLGIITLQDMLYFLPRRYNDYSRLKPINRLSNSEEVTVIGTIQNITTRNIRNGKAQLVEAVINDGTGLLRITWFNQVWLARRLHPGMQIALSGKIDQYLGRLTMNNPEWEPLEQQQLNTNRIVPVYPLTTQITQRWLRKQISQVVEYWAPRLQDPIPKSILSENNLVDISSAIAQSHFPDSWQDLKAAQERLAFDEIILLQLGVLHQKHLWQDRKAKVFTIEAGWMERQTSGLPYSLTSAQQRVLSDVLTDLGSGRPMNRLIQGDVGSGKTVLAALAIALIAESGAQSAMMAPTSILAEQHFRNLLDLLVTTQESGKQFSLNPAPIQSSEIRLMLGSTPESEKSQIRSGLEDGSIKLVIGTHALIEDPVQFANLQLVVVDEQHRFGVRQRAALRSKGECPHLLVMTATPIPRSLALTIYGDLDLSVLDEMPAGRQPVSTYLVMPRDRERAYHLIRQQADAGNQVMIIYPLVEESENLETRAATEEQARLQGEIFPNLKVGLLHGRMKSDEKDKVMSDFRQGKYHVLVSTTVIEVGLDIPNATVMLIEGANRFGLAQLHQLRGRVGRGAQKSYCILIPDHPGAGENERLRAMVETNDGFILAERDLEQRGPGQFLGTQQAGYAELQFANLTNVRLIEKARRSAQKIFANDPELTQPENQLLASALQQFWRGGRGDIS